MAPNNFFAQNRKSIALAYGDDRSNREMGSLRARVRILLSLASLDSFLKARSAFSAADMLIAGHDLAKTTGPRPRV